MMKRINPSAFLQCEKALLSCILLSLALFSVNAQEYRTLHDGVEYSKVQHKIGEEPVIVHLLKLDPAKTRLDVKMGADSVVGSETTSSVAIRNSAVAAINAGFFRLDNSIFAGEPAGTFGIDGRLLSESLHDRAVIGISNGQSVTEVRFGHLSTGLKALIDADRAFDVDGLNRERKPNEMIVYTPEFSRTTLTGPNGAELILTSCTQKAGAAECLGIKVREGIGSSVIPDNGYVISIDNEAIPRAKELLSFENTVKSNKKRTLSLKMSVTAKKAEDTRFFSSVEDLTNGVSMLVENGKASLTWESEKAVRSFAENRHPRTAVAKLKNGQLLLLTADGRQPGVSIGMTLSELAEYLIGIGAVDAINLDGGGSTTMVLDGKVVNSPSDTNGERKVGDVIIVSLRKSVKR